MNAVESLDAAGLDARLAAPADDVADVDVLKLGRPSLFCLGERGCLSVVAGMAVHVVALEDDGFQCDVVHHDVADENLFRASAATKSALEAQTHVGAAERVVAHHHAAHPCCRLATEHETAVGMVHGVVSHDDILAAADGMTA